MYFFLHQALCHPQQPAVLTIDYDLDRLRLEDGSDEGRGNASLSNKCTLYDESLSFSQIRVLPYRYIQIDIYR